jgi:uncharacterized protein YkwD
VVAPWRSTGILLALLLAVAVVAAPSGVAAGKGSACKRWGNAAPDKVASGAARKAVICFLNAKRRAHGLSRLDRNRKLQRAAQRHNDHMVRRRCFAHECPGEPGLEGRLKSVSYLGGGLRRWAYGENIAWGERWRGTPRQIVDAWMHSPPHRAAILHRDFREVGIGFTPATPVGGGDAGGTFTADFGLRVD